MTVDLLDAAEVARIRTILPTSLGTAGLRDEIAAGLRAQSVFTARGTNAQYLTVMKQVLDRLSAGDISMADARVALGESLSAIGYTPEAGFPDLPPGSVPPAVRGSLQDLSSFRRLDLIVKTQLALMAGRGQQIRGHDPAAIAASPAWELFRLGERSAPRTYRREDRGDPRADPREEPRWIIAGGRTYEGRMIAPKGDPVWGELGASGNFDDALDVDHPPFFFQSGMAWREVSRAECDRLGVTASDGTPLDEFFASRPRTLAGELPLPTARMSVAKMDRDLAQAWRAATTARPVPDKPDLMEYYSEEAVLARALGRET